MCLWSCPRDSSPYILTIWCQPTSLYTWAFCCWPGLLRQGYCVEIHYSKLQGFWPLGNNNNRSIFIIIWGFCERWYFGLCWNLRFSYYRVIIIYLEGFWFLLVGFSFCEDYVYFCMVKYLSFHNPCFALRYLFNVNSEATMLTHPLFWLVGWLVCCWGISIYQQYIDLVGSIAMSNGKACEIWRETQRFLHWVPSKN